MRLKMMIVMIYCKEISAFIARVNKDEQDRKISMKRVITEDWKNIYVNERKSPYVKKRKNPYVHHPPTLLPLYVC
jgi:hypothetical protein